MSRMVARSRPKEGKGIGEILSEGFVYIIILVVLGFAARWYFVIFLNSPTNALQRYLGASKAGDVKTAYSLLTADSKQTFGSQDKYDDRWPFAHGLGGHMVDYKIEKITESGDKAEADVTQTVSKSGQKVYEAGFDNYKDHYVLMREGGAWKLSFNSPSTSITSKVAGSR